MNTPTAAQKKQWDEDGYLVFENAITGELASPRAKRLLRSMIFQIR